jgi:hypothetical protein
MSAWRRRGSLICSVLLGALVISCGGSPPPAPEARTASDSGAAVQSAPAQPGNAQPGGQQGSAQPGNAQPSGQQGSAQQRPGGLPVDPSAFPGTGGNLTEDDIANWTAAVDEACKKAGHQKGCLRIKPEYYDNSNNKTGKTGPGENYEVTDVSYPEYVIPGKTITVKGTCWLSHEPCKDKPDDNPPANDNPPAEDPLSGSGGTEG